MQHELRRHVERRSQHEIEAGVRLELASEAQVGDLDVEVHGVLAYEKYILWLDVAVSNRL